MPICVHTHMCKRPWLCICVYPCIVRMARMLEKKVGRGSGGGGGGGISLPAVDHQGAGNVPACSPDLLQQFDEGEGRV